jgi:hypothetical protein
MRKKLGEQEQTETILEKFDEFLGSEERLFTLFNPFNERFQTVRFHLRREKSRRN